MRVLLSALLITQALAAPSLSCGTDLCFASGLSTGAVLQRAPSRAALYGSVHANSNPGTPVVVTLTSTDGTFTKNYTGVVASDLTWKVILDPMQTGGNYTATATCVSCTGGKTSRITDLTFGDVIFCSGQSNMWLPLWFTFERNITTAKVLNGSYANIRLWRGGLGEVEGQGGNFVGPAGVEPGSDSGEALTNQWRHPADVAVIDIRDGEPWFWEFPATCWYAAQFLTDLLGDSAPPFGLMTVPVGGTMLEQWSAPETQADLKNVTCMCMDSKTCDPYSPLGPACTKNSDLYFGNVQPFVNITIKMHFYLQGENNLQYDGGNSALNTGYGALFPAMIAQWRSIWSAVPGTTDPLAPFGYVEIADGSDEAWGISMAGLRWAQSANYGSVPNPVMPNVFSAVTHDAGDPWDADQCNQKGKSCCVTKAQPLGADCVGDHRGEWDYDSTNWFMGQVHPRPKAIVGRRLAQAAYSSVYGGSGVSTGPVLAGCSLVDSSLKITFNAELLKGQGITWSSNASAAKENTALYVLIGSPFPAWAEANHHTDWHQYEGPYAGGNEVGITGWKAIDAVVTGANELTADLSSLGGATPTALRYAYGTGGWGAPFINRMCCGPTVDVSLQPCPMGSCPLHSAALPANPLSALPGVPFLAEITGAGKCKCVAPQVCDA